MESLAAASEPEPMPQTQNPCGNGTSAMLKTWEKVAAANALEAERSAQSATYSKLASEAYAKGAGRVAQGLNVLNLSRTYSNMRDAYAAGDMRTATAGAADLSIDVGSSAIPGWGNIAVGIASDVGGLGDRIGSSIGPLLQFLRDFTFPGSLFALQQANGNLDIAAPGPPGQCNR